MPYRPAEKQLAQDAAVIGEVAWLEAIAAVSGQSLDEIDPVLRALERKEFVRRVRRSHLEGQTEYAFHHVLIRDVAYGAIPRAARSEKHGVAADWIESLGRPQDYAEMLAHHSLRALELAQVAGLPTEAPAERARFALREAGHRARSLGAFAAAESFYTSALELWPAADPDGPRLALAAARSGCDAGSPGAMSALSRHVTNSCRRATGKGLRRRRSSWRRTCRTAAIVTRPSCTPIGRSSWSKAGPQARRRSGRGANSRRGSGSTATRLGWRTANARSRWLGNCACLAWRRGRSSAARTLGSPVVTSKARW